MYNNGYRCLFSIAYSKIRSDPRQVFEYYSGFERYLSTVFLRPLIVSTRSSAWVYLESPMDLWVGKETEELADPVGAEGFDGI